MRELLACPRCDAPLKPVDAGLNCAGCKVDYPSLGGLPMLFAEPAAAIGEWRGRLHMEIQRLEHDSKRFSTAIENESSSDLARRRLELLRHASTDQAERLNVLLEPLATSTLKANYETYLALRTRLPGTQGLNTYYNNVHRDWCWGDEENERSREILTELTPTAGGEVLVLGAGACRLAYDLHRHWQPAITVALDFNPMLMLLARAISAGESIELWEFPLAPKTLDDCAVMRTLSAPAKTDGKLEFVIADALRPPFVAATFDTIVTPWLIDIVPEEFSRLAARINRLLKPGGTWLNFGSLAFDHPDPAENYTPEECAALIESQGFAAPAMRNDTIPYMCSPASRHGRRETVMSFAAEKMSDAGKQPRYQALPDWLVEGDEPVPKQANFEMQAMSSRVYAFVMAMIDGKRSIKDMAKLMEEQRLMPADEAIPTIRSFLIKMLER